MIGNFSGPPLDDDETPTPTPTGAGWGVNTQALTTLTPDYWKSKTYVPDIFDQLAWSLGVTRSTVMVGGVALILVVALASRR